MERLTALQPEKTLLGRDVTRVSVLLLGIAVTLLLAHLLTQYVRYFGGHPSQFGLVRLFNPDAENNVPTWYSSALLLVSAGLLAVVGIVKTRIHDAYSTHWVMLAVIFLFLSIDETASIHEFVGDHLKPALQTTDYLSSPWVIPWSFFTLIVFISYSRFLWHLPAQTRWLVVAAGITYVSGAVSFEMLSAHNDPRYGEEWVLLLGHSPSGFSGCSSSCWRCCVSGCSGHF